MYRALGYNLREEDEETIRKMVAYASNGSPVSLEISDLRCVVPESEQEDTLLVFGSRASRMTEELPHRVRVEFPDVTKLDADFGEEAEREAAQEKLKELKALAEQTPEKTETSDAITEEDLRQFGSGRALQMLVAACTKKGVESWTGTLKDGRTVRLTIEPEQGEADVNITFAELYSIKAAMETLQIKELEIVYKPSVHRKDSS
jgi:hypothetical protein